MSRTTALCSIICSLAIWIILSLATPWVLSDSNSFLKGFVNHELLAFLGVVVTITLASATSLHFELNKLESVAQKRFFSGTRSRVQTSAYSLIGMLLVALFIVVAKPWVGPSDVAISFVNGAALLIVIFNIFVLVDLTRTAFKITAHVTE